MLHRLTPRVRSLRDNDMKAGVSNVSALVAFWSLLVAAAVGGCATSSAPPPPESGVTAPGGGTASSLSSLTSVAPHDPVGWTAEAERVRAGVVEWVKADTTRADFEGLRWVSSRGGASWKVEIVHPSAGPPLPSGVDAPPWIGIEDQFYFRDPDDALDSEGGRWLKTSPSKIVQFADSADCLFRPQLTTHFGSN